MTVLAPSIGAIFASDKCAGRTSKMRKRFTEDEITQLSQSPYVKYIRVNRISFTFEFRTSFGKMAGSSFYYDNKKSIVRIWPGSLHDWLSGYPFCYRKNLRSMVGHGAVKIKLMEKALVTLHVIKIPQKFLLSTGKFIKSGWGITFHPDLVNEIRQYIQISQLKIHYGIMVSILQW